ncbi:pilus assembly protein [Micromonospora zingiberis]|uniref:Pilus assembly protein n=1 Tax=Micromonospora zingiberis TaxID=2053011 RepID=A0A4R0G5K2_9ACTN|nr:TadE family protein [Micromonospora zingiberis]TCB91636.1 pilus assembly protein [Micromonospora zingiberis]
MVPTIREHRAERPPSPALGAAGRLRARWRQVTARPDSGAATAELAIAMPLLLLMVMFVIQAGVFMHATHVAQSAATRAANTAAGYDSSAAAGRDAGGQTLAAIGNGVLKDPSVSVTRTATEVRVEIVGQAATVVPGVRWTVRATVVRPTERFVPHAADGSVP